MSKTYIDYRRLLQSLLPKGPFWTRSESSVFTKFLNGLSDEFVRVDVRSENLRSENICDTITELLTEHEDDYAIPDPGQSVPSTTDARRRLIKAKRIAVGEQNKEYYIEIATALNWTITITEIPKFLVGLSLVGDGSVIAGGNCVFYWFVNVWVVDPNNANIKQLMYEIESRAPGHTKVLFRFYNVGFSDGFDNGFSAVPWWDGSWWPLGFDRGFGIGFANACDYDGERLIGGFSSGFDESFYTYKAGGFDFNGFDSGFNRPA